MKYPHGRILVMLRAAPSLPHHAYLIIQRTGALEHEYTGFSVIIRYRSDRQGD